MVVFWVKLRYNTDKFNWGGQIFCFIDMSLYELQTNRRNATLDLVEILPREYFVTDDDYKNYLLGKYSEIKMTQFRYLAQNEAMSLYNREMYAISEGQYVSGPEPHPLVHNDYGVWNNYRLDGFRAKEKDVEDVVEYEVGDEFIDNPAKYASSISRYFETTRGKIDEVKVNKDLNEKRRKYKDLEGNALIEAVNNDLEKEGKLYRVDKDGKTQYLGLDGGESCAIGVNCTVYSMLKKMGYENNPFVNTTNFEYPGTADNVACASVDKEYYKREKMSLKYAIENGILKEGDAFAKPRSGGTGHAMFVAGIIRNENKEVTHVTIAETNHTNMKTYPIDELGGETYQNGAQINKWVGVQVGIEVENMKNMSVEEILGAVNNEASKLNGVVSELERTENACHQKGYDSWCCSRHCKLDKDSNETATHCLASSYDLYANIEERNCSRYFAQNEKIMLDHRAYACAEKIIELVMMEDGLTDILTGYKISNMQPAFRDLLKRKISDENCDATQWLADIISQKYETIASDRYNNKTSEIFGESINIDNDKVLVNDVISSLYVNNIDMAISQEGGCFSYHFESDENKTSHFCTNPDERDNFLAQKYMLGKNYISEDDNLTFGYLGYLEYIRNKDKYKPDEKGNISVTYSALDENGIMYGMREYSVIITKEQLKWFEEAHKYIQDNYYAPYEKAKQNENKTTASALRVQRGLSDKETEVAIASAGVVPDGVEFDKKNNAEIIAPVVIDKGREA